MIKIWLICIFNLLSKCLNYVFLSSVQSFYCMSLNLVYLALIEVILYNKYVNFWLICIFNMTAKVANLCSKYHIILSTDGTAVVSILHMYLWWRLSEKYASLAHSHIQGGPTTTWSSFQNLQQTLQNPWYQICVMCGTHFRAIVVFIVSGLAGKTL